jgi:hypothetical protein
LTTTIRLPRGPASRRPSFLFSAKSAKGKSAAFHGILDRALKNSGIDSISDKKIDPSGFFDRFSLPGTPDGLVTCFASFQQSLNREGGE